MSALIPTNLRSHTKKDFGPIPIKQAMIAWNDGNGRGDARIQVVPWPDADGWVDRLDLQNTTGACYGLWQTWSKPRRQRHLLIEAWTIANRDGVPIKRIHEALSVIPEYTEMLSEDFA